MAGRVTFKEARALGPTRIRTTLTGKDIEAAHQASAQDHARMLTVKPMVRSSLQFLMFFFFKLGTFFFVRDIFIHWDESSNQLDVSKIALAFLLHYRIFYLNYDRER